MSKSDRAWWSGLRNLVSSLRAISGAVDPGILLVLLLGLAVRLLFFQGFLGMGAAHDDLFSSKAYDVVQSWKSGAFWAPGDPKDPLALRMGIILPTALSYLVFGVNEASMALYPLACSLISLFLTIYLGTTLFDRHTGLLAGLLLAVFPLDVLYATVLWPDTPMCTFQLLALLLLLKGEREGNTGITSPGMLFLAGFSVGLAYIAKVSGLLIILPMAAYLFNRRARVWAWGWVAVGLLMGFLVETVYLWVASGDLLARIRWFNPMRDHGVPIETIPGATDSMQLAGRVLWSFPSMMLVPLNRKIVYFGLFGWSLVAGAYYLFRHKDSKSFPVLAWWVLLYLGILFLPRGFSPIHFAHNVKPVYLLPIVYPAALITARALVLSEDLGRYAKRAGLAVLCVAAICGLVMADYAAGRNMAYNSREIARYLESHPGKPVLVDPGTKTNLEFFLGYADRRLVQYDHTPLETVNAGFVVVNESMLHRKLIGYTAPHQILNPPDNWERIEDIRNPAYERGLFRLIEWFVQTVAQGYAFVSPSGQWGTKQDDRDIKQVFQDFARPAYIYRVRPPGGS